VNNRLAIIPLAAAGASAVALIAASPHPAHATTPSGDVATTARITSAHRVDLPPHGPSVGDMTTFGGRLLGPGLTGRYQAYCVSVSRSAQECSLTFVAPGGKITAQALYGQGATALTPITGGSGTYADARGDISEREIHNGREVRLVFHLK
jgi:allene oxide cyclase